MRRERTPEAWERIADACRAYGLIEDGDYLAPKRHGRPEEPKGPSGETADAEALADLWCEIRDRGGAGAVFEFESDDRVKHLSAANREEFLDRLWRLEGRDEVRRVLRFRGEK